MYDVINTSICVPSSRYALASGDQYEIRLNMANGKPRQIRVGDLTKQRDVRPPTTNV